MSGTTIIPQSYPLYVAWYERYSMKDERGTIEDFAAMTKQQMRTVERRNCEVHLVIAWEVSPDTVPTPIVADIGRDSGLPVYGISEEEVVEKYLNAAEANHEWARNFLAKKQ